MANTMSAHAEHVFGSAERAVSARPAYQAYQLLHIAFVLAPILAGIDKFLHVMVNWDMYLAPTIANLSPISGHNLMLCIGVVEVVAGLIVAFKPSIGAWIVAIWLWLIIINLLMIPSYFDIALRDFGLSLGAVALARLSTEFSS